MSDTPNGPGWWIASDGKWYPPESHPSRRGAPPADQPEPAATPFAPWQPPQEAPPSYGPPASYGQSPDYGPSSYGPPPYGGGWGQRPGYGFDPYTGYPRRPVDPSSIDGILAVALAPWWKRVVAYLIDSAIIWASCYFLVIVGLAANIATTHGKTNDHDAGVIGALLVGGTLVASIIYYSLMNGSTRGQTLGKMAMSIAVRDQATGGRIGPGAALGRYLIMLVFSILPFILLIDLLAPLWDRRRRAWHDHVARSVVVDLKR